MFFGIIRQAAGSNDHPSAPTFLQLYKLLSTYSILKPPKSGNCTVNDDSPLTPLISISDLKNIYNLKLSYSYFNLFVLFTGPYMSLSDLLNSSLEVLKASFPLENSICKYLEH